MVNFMVVTESEGLGEEIKEIIKEIRPDIKKNILHVGDALEGVDYQFYRKFADVAIIDADTVNIDMGHRLKYLSDYVLLIYLDSQQRPDRYINAEPYKVVALDQLQEALNTAIHRLSKFGPSMFVYSKNGVSKRVEAAKILYFWSDKRKRCYKTNTGDTDYFYEDMDELEERLKPLGFARVSKSYIVNARHIVNMENDGINMPDGTCINVGRKWKLS